MTSPRKVRSLVVVVAIQLVVTAPLAWARQTHADAAVAAADSKPVT